MLDENNTDAASLWHLVPQSQLCERGIPPVDWEFEGFLDAGSAPALIFGAPGELKSSIALHLAWCSATGEPAFGRFKTRRRPSAIYVNFDASPRSFQRRATMLPRTDRLLIANPDGYDPKQYRALVERNHGAFIVSDCLADMYQPKSNGEQGVEMRRFVRPLRALYEQHECGGIIVDHSNRDREVYGSIQKPAGFRSVIQVERVKRADMPATKAIARLTCVKASETEPFASFLVELCWEGGFTARYVGEDGKRASVAKNAAKRHADSLRPHLNTDESKALSVGGLHKRSGLSKDQVRSGLNALKAQAVGNGSGRRYFLPQSVAGNDGEPMR